MRKWNWIFIILVIALGIPIAQAVNIDQAMPGSANQSPAMPGAGANGIDRTIATADAPARLIFAGNLHLDDFRLMAIQPEDQLKIVDSWAREALTTIRNRQSIDSQDPVYTVMDMMIRPEAWQGKNFIYVQAVPIRQILAQFATGPESDRIQKEGLVSPAFLQREEVQRNFLELARDTRNTKMVGQLWKGYNAFSQLPMSFLVLPPPAGVTLASQPAPTGTEPAVGRLLVTHWHHPFQLLANLPNAAEKEKEYHINIVLPLVPQYSLAVSMRSTNAFDQIWDGWAQGDANLVNKGMAGMQSLAQSLDPENYPTLNKRTIEVWYNRTSYGTVFNVFLYFISMSMFLMVAVGVTKSQRFRRVAFTIFTVSVLLHLTSMSVRFWLADRWPTQNQFESVLGSALLGCLMGWGLELYSKKGLFGMAFSFVGFLAMTVCMVPEYMFGRDIGGAIEKTSGILQTYWLKIHVNIVISSYALIAASFVLGITYLLTRQWYWVNPIEPEGNDLAPNAERRTPNGGGGAAIAASPLALTASTIESQRSAFLEVLDQANMVVLQMAFWFLGIGIICGAVWADQSWGRPWGWDPKETFALVTWMVYLIIVHIRMFTKSKADATAWLSVVGFGVMLFNWIGVNYMLVGLHSYA